MDGAGQLGDKGPVQLGKDVPFGINDHVPRGVRRPMAAALHQVMPMQHIVRNGGYPDIGVGQGVKQIELAAPLIEENPTGGGRGGLSGGCAGRGSEKIAVLQQGGGGEN